MPAPLDQSRREKRLTVLRNSGSLQEAAMLLNISAEGLRKWVKGEGYRVNDLLLQGPQRPPADAPPDTFTMRAADALAERIETYWRDRGHEVNCRVVFAGELHNSPYFAVRSDMINGLPARLARRGA